MRTNASRVRPANRRSSFVDAVLSISANIAEGYSRTSGRERAKFFEYANSSAREARDWLFKVRDTRSRQSRNRAHPTGDASHEDSDGRDPTRTGERVIRGLAVRREARLRPPILNLTALADTPTSEQSEAISYKHELPADTLLHPASCYAATSSCKSGTHAAFRPTSPSCLAVLL